MAAPVAELVHPSWAPALSPLQPQFEEIGAFLRQESAAGRPWAPAGANILRAFGQPLDDVRVLIVGQDPYPTAGHAVGLSFSVAPDVRPLPRSLQNIVRELHDDLGLPAPRTGDLTPWTEHGVLLLNRVLTVRLGEPGSHRGIGWEAITAAAITALVDRPDQPLVAILWGRDAQTLAARPARRARHRQRPPESDVGRSRLLRLAAVQPGQRAARRAGRRPRRLVA